MLAVVEPLIRAAVVAAVLAALGRAAEQPPRTVRLAPVMVTQPTQAPAADLAAACPPGTLPDARVCIPVPTTDDTGLHVVQATNSHRDAAGRFVSYDVIPRRPDRPAEYAQYRLPVIPLPGSVVGSGFDLDRPDAEQRRGAAFSAVGHGGIDIPQPRRGEVRTIPLEHQEGHAEVLYVGPLFGNSVVTRHVLRESGQRRDYVVVWGHLEGPAPGLAAGRELKSGELVGFAGDSGSPGVVHLHFEVRRVREGVDPRGLGPGQLVQNSKTVACDPRNVLPRK